MKKQQLRTIIKKSLDDSNSNIPTLKRTLDEVANMIKVNRSMKKQVEGYTAEFVEASLSNGLARKELEANFGKVEFTTKADFLKSIDNLGKTLIKIERECRSIVFDIMNESNGVNDYGVPDNQSYSTLILTEDDWENIEMEVSEKVDVKLSEEQINQTIEYVVDCSAVVMDLMQKEYGDEFQSMRVKIAEVVATSTFTKLSGKASKLYNTERDEEFVVLLQPYWDWKFNDIEMPNNHTRDSLFQEIATEYKIGVSRVRQIERRLRKDNVPAELGINEVHPSVPKGNKILFKK